MPQESSGGRRASPLRALFPWALLFVSAVVLRSLRFGLVFGDGDVRFPYDADEMYHLRRIWFTVVNFPASLDFDRYLNHPEGAPPIWPPAFDWFLAALARLLVGRDQRAVEVFAAWIPPLIGALSVIAATWLARRTFSPAAGWLTGVLLVFLPGHIFYSALGMVDHHVAVGLLATLLVAAAMPLAGAPAPNGRPRGAVVAAAVAAAAILLWPGALLHVLIVQLFLVAQLLASAGRGVAVGRARSLAVMHGVAAAMLFPFCVGREWKQFGAYTPQVLSNFQPLWFAAGAVALAFAAWLWSFAAFDDRWRRLASALGLGALGLVAAWLLVPGLSEAVADAAEWFEADPYLAVISELEPLLYYGGTRFTPALANQHFTYLFWVYPLALAGLAWRALARQRGDVLLLLFASAAFCAATLNQVRFGDVFAAGFAWVMGPALAEGLGAARRRLAAPRSALAGAGVVVALAALLPTAPSHLPEVRASVGALRGQPIARGPNIRMRTVLKRVARWLQRETPATQGYLDPAARPEYGVLCAWGHGSQLLYYGERPMVQTNFGPWGGRAGFEAAGRYFGSRDERTGAAIAEALGARYVVATNRGSGQRSPKADSLERRLVLVPIPGGGVGLRDGPDHALARHRLVFVADDSDLIRLGAPPWRAAVYEIVRGARVRGRAPGTTAVEFELAVPLQGREPVRYRARAPVDLSGGYEIRLPYPSEEGYAVRSGSERRSLTLTEDDVREGRTVAGPSFEPRRGLPET